MPYAAPVLAERAHVAQRAQRPRSAGRSGEAGARTLGDAVAAQLRSVNVDPTTVEWDAWRREDGRWTLTGAFSGPGRDRARPTFAFDVRGNFVILDDDDARWLVGEQVSRPAPPAAEQDEPAASRDDLRRPAGAGCPPSRRTSCRWARTPSSWSTTTSRPTPSPPWT